MNPKIGVRGPELVSWAQIGMNQQPTYRGQYLMLLPWKELGKKTTYVEDRIIPNEFHCIIYVI